VPGHQVTSQVTSPGTGHVTGPGTVPGARRPQTITAPVQIAVCGPRECTDTEASSARRVGQLLAEAGAVVICGGGQGVMAAVAAGARSAGGTVVGIRPGSSRDDASPDLSVTIVTNIGEARNAIIVWSADAVIAVGGSWGTLSEVALAQRRGGVPVVVLNGWQVLDADGAPVGGIDHVSSPEDAVAHALSGVARR
jgi:uncharacterized protein (TIGR00725 family)